MTASCMLGLNEDGEVVEAGSMGGGPEVTASCIHLGVRRDGYFCLSLPISYAVSTLIDINN